MNIYDTCICIPTNRPEVAVLKNFKFPLPVFIVSDPDTVAAHKSYYHDIPNVHVVEGAKGMSPQAAACFQTAWRKGFDYFFRMDDEIEPSFFLKKDKSHPDLLEVITAARTCIEETKTTLAGFSNTGNAYWLGEGYGRTYGLITGGAHISISTDLPSNYIDVSIDTGKVHYEDVYRSLRHRELDGAVGRVRFIGVNKKGATASAEVIPATKLDRAECIRKIVERFPGRIKCDGTKWINNGTVEIAKWTFLREPKK